MAAEEEEFEGRVISREVMYVPPGVGPPWYEARTGEVLDEAMTIKGMEDEIKSVQNFHTYDEGEGRKSTSGGTVWMRGFLLGHWCRTQPTIALSTCEAEL
eukprot:3430287-Heterocapsa_arctica.AAC.1